MEIKETGFDLIKFGASWCGPCKMYKPVLEEIQNERGYSIVDVDIDENPELAEQSDITSVPTLIITKEGTEVHRIVGLHSKEQIYEIIEKL